MIDIAKARAICAAATPGPWRVVSEPDNPVTAMDDCVVTDHAPDLEGLQVYVAQSVDCRTGNAAFIASARALLPEALDALEEEQDSKKRGWALAMEHADTVNALKAEVGRLTRHANCGWDLAEEREAENARLRQALEWYAEWLGAPGNYPHIAANEDRGGRARSALAAPQTGGDDVG